MQYAMASTPKNFSKERMQEYNEALSLDFNLIRSHIEQAVRFAEMEPAIQDVNKIVNDKKFKAKINSKNIRWRSEIITPWLARTALQENTKTVGNKGARVALKVLGALRRNANNAIMFGNLSNTVENLTDVPVFVKEVKPENLFSSLKKVAFNPKESVARIKSKSDFMKLRMETDAYEINTKYRELSNAQNEVVKKFEDLQDLAKGNAYILQRGLQAYIEPSAWLAAFDEQVASGASDKDAARYADSMIRRIAGSTRANDLATIEAQNELVKSLLNFYGYFITRANLIAYSGQGNRAKAYYLGAAIPAILSRLIKKATPFALLAVGLKDEDEVEDIDLSYDAVDTLLLSQIRYAAAAIPFVGGTGVRLLEAQFTKPVYDDRINLSPIISTAEKIKGVKNLITKDDVEARDLKDAMSVFSMLSGLPLSSQPMMYLIDTALEED